MRIHTTLTIQPRPVLECVHADTCLSDYWSGHHLPHVQIPVYRGMTLKQIKADLIDELKNGYISGAGDAACIMNYGTDEYEANREQADALHRAAIAAVRRMRPATPGQRRFFMDLEELDDPEHYDSESVFAYFVFRDL
jgi:hypothetical protein